jgi:hypothetical protein
VTSERRGAERGVEPLTIDAFGITVAVVAPDDECRARWAAQWARCLVADAEPAVTIDAAEAVRADEPDVTDYSLTTRVTTAALEQVGSSRLSLHAAGLTDDLGRVLALVAASGTGKTTAARTLGRHLGYLSDETVSVGADLDVRSYQKPLSIVVDADVPFRKRQHPPEELGLREPVLPARLTRLVGLSRGGPEPGLRPISMSEAVTLLVPQTSYVTGFAAPVLEITRLVHRVGGMWELGYAEIGDHLDALQGLLDAPDQPDEVWQHLPPLAPPTQGPAGSLARMPWSDAVAFDDAVVVLYDALTYRLDHLAGTLWLTLDAPRTTTELAQAAVDVHGPHPDADRLVSGALDVLVEAALVRRF